MRTNRTRHMAFVIAVLLVGSHLPAAAQSSDAAAAIAACETCHGPNGNSGVATTPRLNGQLSAYIVHRLRALTNLTTESPHASSAMSDIAHMKDALRTEIANLFADKIPTSAEPQSNKIAVAGATLYAQGDAANNVEACQGCHGAQGEGQGLAPRLSGLHRAYLSAQLWNFNFGLRENSAMHPVAGRLSPEQIEALVAYLGAD